MTQQLYRFAIPVAFVLVWPTTAFAQLQAQPFVSGLSFPVGFVFDPTASNRQFVVERTGRIRVVVDGLLQPTDFLDLSGAITTDGAERGLLGLALAPDYPDSGRLFVAFTRAPAGGDESERGDVVVARFTRSAGNPLVADPATRFDLRWGGAGGPSYIEHSSRPSHNGGGIVFGPDGYLYIGVGDGGGNGDPDNNAQNPLELKGKILRIDVGVPDGHPQGYEVPADNPFVDDVPIDALPEIWALGVRNPWRFTFDDPALGGTGALIVADVGQDRWEEINYEAVGDGGRNYGWRILEGTNPYFNTEVPNYMPPPPAFLPLSNPAFEYFHSVDQSPVEGFSVTGGYVYRGRGMGPAWQGRYFFADFSLARIWSARVTPTGATAVFSNVVEHTDEVMPGHMSSFAIDPTGELYIVRYGAVNQGEILRLCGYSLTPVVNSFTNQGGTGSIRVTAPAGCSWSVAEDSPWITLISNNQGTGPGVVVFRVAPTALPAERNASILIAGRPLVVSQRPTMATLGDIDGSGSADLIWQHADGRLAAWLMNGTSMLGGQELGPGPLADPAWQIVAAADFDRDGSRDLLFQHQTDGRLAFWLMSGTTLLSGVALGQVPDTGWKVRGSADFNRDGWMDLVWHHQGDGRVAVWLLQGTQLRSGLLLSAPVVADVQWQIVGAADMNEDGHTDLIWHNQTTGLLSIWWMNELALIEGVLTSPAQVPDTNWKIRGVGDFNGDGKPDLIWQHQTVGLLSVWLMNGRTLTDGVLLSPSVVTDTQWRIVGPK